MDYSLRRTWIITEQIHAEHGREVDEVITRIVGLAAIDNPYHADHQEDLSPLFHIGAAVGKLLMAKMVPLSPNRRYATNQDAEVQILAWAGNLTSSGAQFQGRFFTTTA